MNQTALDLRNYAKNLIAYEVSQTVSFESTHTAAFVVIEKLIPHFSTLMGAAGFRALISRSLLLANAEVAWLRDLRVKEDSSFEGLKELAAKMSPEEIAAGGIVILAQLLGLLMTLIGEDLTLRLLNNIDNLKFGIED